MKLHLPKQLFTALITAVTLAAAPAAWGVDNPNDLNVSRLGNFYAGDFAFSFTIGEDDLNSSDTSDVLGLYWGDYSTSNFYSNGFVLNYNNDGTITLTVGDGSMGGVGDTQDVAQITENTSFTPDTTAGRKKTFTVELESGATYILKNTGADRNQTVSLLKDGQVIGSVSYNGNMAAANGATQTLKSLGNEEYDVTSVSLWKGTGENNGLTTQSNGKYTNIFGTPASLEGANLVFTAEESVSKTVTLDGTNLSVAGISVYGNYTFEASADTTLTTTNGTTIASGAALTLSGSGNITLSGPVNIAGELTLASSNQFSNLGITTVQNGGVLNLTTFNTDKTFFKDVNDQASLTTKAGGYVKMKLQGGDNKDKHELKLDGNVTLAKNVWFVDEYVAVHGDSVNRTLTIAENTYFRASAGLQLWSDARIKVDGGHLIADSGITLGHYSVNGDHWGKLEMTSGSITTGTISFNQQANNAITITGGELTFTAAQAFATATDKTVAVSIGGEGESTVTLKTAGTAWTLDGSVLTTAPTIGNVTIDAENAHGITLKNVNLTGAINNNSSLTIGAATVADGSTVSIGGSGITALTGAITNNGSLTLNGTLDVQDVSTMAARPEGAVTYAGGQVEGNGFRSQEYILIQGGSITYDEGFKLLVAGSAVTPTVQSSSELSAAVRDGSFHVFTGEETIESSAATSYYVAKGGTLTFSDALTGARTMNNITGTGTVAITIGDTSGHGNTLTASNFNGVLQISKDAAGNGNVNLDNFGLGTSASFKLVSGNHWSNDNPNISRAIELAGEGVDDFAFRHDGSLELSGKVTGTYLTAGRNYGSSGVSTKDNNLTLSGADSNIQHVTMKGGTLTVNAGMTFGTLSAKAVSLGNGTALNVGSGNVEGLLTLGTNASLTVSNGTLNLLGGVSSAADSADSTALPSITGNVGIASTLQVDGYLTMNGSVTLSGDLASNYTSYKNATETYVLYALNKETGSYEYVETASGNGFLKVNGASYWLTQGENGGITLNGITEGQTTVRHGEADYTLYRDNGDEGEGTSGHYYFLVSENTGTVYYVTAGSVDVDSAVQGKATGYVLNTADPDNEAIMNIKDGKVNTSLISYTSGKINLKAGAVLNVDAETNNMTVGGLLSGIVTAEDAATSKLVIAQSGLNTGDDGLVTKYNGTVELAQGVTFTFGSVGNAKDNQVVNTSSLAGVILNDNSVLQFQGTGDNSSVSGGPSLSQFQNVTVNGAAKIHLIDTQNSDEQDAVYLTGTTTLNNTLTLTAAYDGRIIIDNLEGSGTLSAQGTSYNAPQGNSGDQFYTTINGLNGFSGTLDFTDTSKHTVVVKTGTDAESVSFNKLQFATGSGVSNTFNVQTDTTVGTIKGACTIDIAETGTLHTFTKEGTDTITLTGYGTYDFGDYDIGGENANTSATYNSAISVTYGEGWYGTVRFGSGSSFRFKDLDLEQFANGGNSTIELAGVTGYLQSSTSSEKSYSADFKFTGDGLTIDNGYGGSKYKFTGDFSGLGNLTLNRDLSNGLQFTFAGDMSEWTGELKHKLDPQNKYIYDAAEDVLDTTIGNKLTAAGGANHDMEVTVKTNRDVVMNGELRATAGSTLNVTKENEGNLSVKSVAVEKTGVVNVAGLSISATDSTADATMTQKADTQGALTRLHEDASFTIQDMTLTNTTVTAATVDTKVNLSNVSVGADSLVTLAKGAFTVQDQANVAMGGSACNFTTSSYSGFVLGAAGEASITLNLGDLSQLTPMGPGVYDIAILLDGFQMTGDNASVLFAADSWLGQLLAQSNNANVEISISQAADASEAAAAGAATGVSYSTGNVGTIITINGLNVPEPTTSTLSLLALAGLCARRRRKM